MDSLQLQWAAIFAAATLGIALLIYDIKNRKVPARFITEDANVKLKIEELWHYPIKGLRGIRINSGKIGPQGFEDDRTFCLQKIHRDPATKEITLWETMYSGFHLQMVLFAQTLEEGKDGKDIIITRVGPENPHPERLEWTGSEYQLRIPLRPNVKGLEKIHLDLHGSATDTYDMGDDVSKFFTKYMGFETKMMYIGNNSRVVLGSGAPNGAMAQARKSPYLAPLRKLLPSSLTSPPETITFQDIGQYLVVTKESNDEVSSRLGDGKQMDIHKFRPNIIVSGSPAPYDEDYWSQVAITVDYNTGKKAEGEEGLVWKKLAADRRLDKGFKYSPVFGKYSYTAKKDWGKEIRARDEILLTKRVKDRPQFDWPLSKAIVSLFKA
ncbi:hypothetical protein HRS9139_09381 [Pyrenophora teres f. teres]|nr:hypothetical protein HRS9139_09381 [Pyrenophora teres f. teres]